VGRLGDSQTVFQHLKANNFTIGDGEYDREVRLDDLVGSLELGLKRSKDHGSIVTGHNVEDVKADALNHGAGVINKIGNSGPARFLSDPRQSASVTRYFPVQTLAEQLGDVAGSAPLAMRPRNSCARRRLSFWLMGSLWLSDWC
jgi:hypothetical protein